MATGYTTVSASALTDPAGNSLNGCTILFRPCNNNGSWISFQVNNAGQAVYQPVKAVVVNGGFSVQLADTALTSPVNIFYRVEIYDAQGDQILGPGYLIQPTGATWDFDLFVPNTPGYATVQTGPATALSIGTVTTGAPGSQASVTITGNAPTQQLNLTIPQGPAGGTGGSFGTNTPAIAAGAGSAGVATTSSRSDHAHPSELANDPVVPGALGFGSTGAILALPKYGDVNAVIALSDANGDSPLWVDPFGAVHIEGGAVIDGPLTLPFGEEFAGIEIATTLLEKIPLYGDLPAGTAFAEVDGSGYADRYVDSTGSTGFPANVSVHGSLTASLGAIGRIKLTLGASGAITGPNGIKGFVLSSGVAIVCVPFLGRTNIFSVNGATVTQLTRTGNNSVIGLTSAGQILFATDRSGKPELWTMNTDGSSPAFLKALPANEATTYGFQGVGQSLIDGAYDTALGWPISNPTAVMLNGGTRAHQAAGGAVLASDIASILPLVESSETLDGIGVGETLGTAMTVNLASFFQSSGLTPTLYWGVNGYPNEPYSAMAKGTQTYANGIAMITAAFNLTKNYVHLAMVCALGESDDLNNNTNFGANILTMQQNYEADVQAITGQWQGIPLLIFQPSSWTNFSNRATPVVAPQIDAAAQANPGKIIDVGPSYFLDYANGTHISTRGQRQRGEYAAKAIKSYIQTGDYQPLRILSWSRSGAVITLTLNPVGQLVIDTTTVTQPTNVAGSMYGFEFYDGSGNSIAISSVAIVGTNQLQITTASATAGTLRYAWTGVAGASAGPTTGPRGNIRDSDPTPSEFFLNPLWNWLIHSSFTVS
ncbi:hypothetical protein [Silvibacterium acidisoli]|uniref:hypothetical protein n=1 Tax=Acidobacteriaceae bacterium ZG23-2 TaxID=2883246 RepID=UPI00406CFC7A